MTRPTRSACRLLALFAIAPALALAGCAPAATDPGGSMTSNNTPKPFGGTRPAKEVFIDFLDTIDDAVQHSGTTFPGWDRNKTAGYSTESCGIESKEDGNRYTVIGNGGPVEDPDKAIQEMKSHWEAKGYTIGNIFTNMGGNATARQINATTPSGIFVQFTPGKTRSTLNIKSDCTLDPLARETTTESIPLGGTATASSASAGS